MKTKAMPYHLIANKHRPALVWLAAIVIGLSLTSCAPDASASVLGAVPTEAPASPMAPATPSSNPTSSCTTAAPTLAPSPTALCEGFSQRIAGNENCIEKAQVKAVLRECNTLIDQPDRIKNIIANESRLEPWRDQINWNIGGKEDLCNEIIAKLSTGCNSKTGQPALAILLDAVAQNIHPDNDLHRRLLLAAQDLCTCWGWSAYLKTPTTTHTPEPPKSPEPPTLTHTPEPPKSPEPPTLTHTPEPPKSPKPPESILAINLTGNLVAIKENGQYAWGKFGIQFLGAGSDKEIGHYPLHDKDLKNEGQTPQVHISQRAIPKGTTRIGLWVSAETPRIASWDDSCYPEYWLLATPGTATLSIKSKSPNGGGPRPSPTPEF